MGTSAHTMPTSENRSGCRVVAYFNSLSDHARGLTASGFVTAPRGGTFHPPDQLAGNSAPATRRCPGRWLPRSLEVPPPPPAAARASSRHPRRWPPPPLAPRPSPAASLAACCFLPSFLAPPSVAVLASSRRPRRWPPLPPLAATPPAGAGAGTVPAAGQRPRHVPPPPPLAAGPAPVGFLRRVPPPSPLAPPPPAVGGAEDRGACAAGRRAGRK